MSNSKYLNVVDVWKRRLVVRVSRERGTTQTIVKVPKYQLSVKGRKVLIVEYSEEVGSEAAIL